jgi:glycosyltransferase involved in cell wall biosynthesis
MMSVVTNKPHSFPTSAMSNPTRRRPSGLDPLQICVVVSTYPRHEQDYAVPWLRESICQLARRGHQVTVLAPAFEGLTDHLIDGVPVMRFRYSPRRWERLTHEQGAPNRIRNPWYQLLGAPYLWMGCRAARRLALRQRFDLVHVHWPFPHEPIGSAAARICAAPLVMTAHGAEFALARRKLWVAACLKRSLRKADLLIANSSDTAAQIRSLSHCEATVLPFGSSVVPYLPRLRSAGPARVLFTGRLIQRKGVEYLLRAVPLVLHRRHVQFVITGDGDERHRLETLCNQLGIAHAVQFLGFVSNQRLTEEYARCDVWVNPAIVDDRGDTEGLGVGAIEAYAHNKPVVASNVGGIPDVVIHEKTGLLVPEKDPRALASAILGLVDDPAKAHRLGTTGRRFAEHRFNWDHITDQLESLYRSVLPGKAGRNSSARQRSHMTTPPTGPLPLGTDLEAPAAFGWEAAEC